MNEIEKLTTSEKAYEDYIKGMKYTEIAQKHNVSVNTIKSWKKRYKWERNCTTKKGCSGKSVQALGNNLYQEIREDLLTQLNTNGTTEKRYVDLVEDYMALWDIKKRLIEDVKEHGVSIEWSNGKQVGKKKNDSVSDFIKVNEQMLKILTYLKLEPSPADKGDDDLEM